MRIDYQIEGGLALIVRLIDYAELCLALGPLIAAQQTP
jgi:hypothetical protein